MWILLTALVYNQLTKLHPIDPDTDKEAIDDEYATGRKVPTASTSPRHVGANSESNNMMIT